MSSHSGRLAQLIAFGLALCLALIPPVAAKNIGGEAVRIACCNTCGQSTLDAPGGNGSCFNKGTCSGATCAVSLTDGKIGEQHSGFAASAANGIGVEFTAYYASYNADYEKAVVNTVLGYGWSHSYNIYLFPQRSDWFKMSPTGLTTKYRRMGRRSGPLVATRGHQQTVVENLDGSKDIINNDELTHHFEAIPGNPLRVAGREPLMLTRITDRNGNTTDLIYSGGLLDKVTGPYGREVKFDYGGGGTRLTQVTDPLGRTTAFSYDGAGNLATITDPLGQTTSYVYNASHQITRKTDRNGRDWRIEYNAGRHPVSVRDDSWNALFLMSNSSDWATSSSHLFRGKQRVLVPSTTTLVDGRGNSSEFDYDENGHITRAEAPDGATNTYTYDPLTLNMASETDANGQTTLFEYDPKANLTKVIDALGNETKFEYEPVFNMRTKMTDANGRETSFDYDAFGNRIKETDPLGGMSSWTYDPQGNVLTETDRNGHISTHVYDALGNRIKTTDAEGDMTTMTYDIMGNLLSRTDDNTHTTSFAYDALDRLIKKTDPLGNMTLTGYDPEGNRLSVTDRNGNTSSFVYDERDRLVRTTDALGQMETMTYDGNDNRRSMTDKNGHVTTFTYDVQDRMRKTTDAEGFMTTRAYDPVGNVLVQTDANGHATTMVYDALDRAIMTTDAEGFMADVEYDMVGLIGCPACTGPTMGSSLVTQQTDAEGKVTYFKYDGLDRKIREIRKQTDVGDVIDADDAVTVTVFDPVGNTLSMTEPNGNITEFGFDDVDRVIEERVLVFTGPDDVSLTSYDGVGNVETVTSPNGNVTTNHYDALDRLEHVEDSIGAVAWFSYDPEGNRLTERDGNGNGSDFKYDDIYRVIEVTDALGEMTYFAYDPVGNLLSVTDREGNVTAHEYDDINRRIRTIDALPAITDFDYDGVGSLVRITDANGHATEYEYDAIDRLVKETYADPVPNVRRFAYDGVGNLLTRIDQESQTTNYFYTDLYFLEERVYPVSGDDSFTYDLSGRMLSACRKGSPDDLPADGCDGWLVTFDYDGANRVVETTQNGKAIGYVYDILGRTHTVAYPGGRVIVEAIDARERLDDVNDGGLTAIADYLYDLGNRVVTRTYRNGVVAGYSYDANNWIVNLDHSDGGGQIAGFGYDYDNEGNKRFEDRQHQSPRSEAYLYDETYRLIDYKVGTLVGDTVLVADPDIQYDLDLVGNWNQKTTNGMPEVRTHNQTNEILTIDVVDIFYDDNGNMIEDQLYVYSYDEENRLIQAIRKGIPHPVGQYAYDALSRRVMKIEDPFLASAPVETRYLYDDARVIEEQDSAMTTLATYVYGNYIDEVMTMERVGGIFYYHQNALWSVEAVTDPVGSVAEQYAYDAYGLVMVSSGAGMPVPDNPWGTSHSAIGNPYLFTGRRLDEETGLYNYRARFFDAVKGRFLQRDPLGYLEGFNLYEYVSSNPVNSVDPTGTLSEEKIPIGQNLGLCPQGVPLGTTQTFGRQRFVAGREYVGIDVKKNAKGCWCCFCKYKEYSGKAVRQRICKSIPAPQAVQGGTLTPTPTPQPTSVRAWIEMDPETIGGGWTDKSEELMCFGKEGLTDDSKDCTEKACDAKFKFGWFVLPEIM